MSRGLRRAVWAIMAVAGFSVVVVAASGWWLAQNYQPGAWVETSPDHFRIELGGGWIHETHVWSAIILQVAAVAFLVIVVLAFARRTSTTTTVGSALTSAAMAVVVAMGFVSGRDLRWDQLALWAVTVGDDFRGIWSNAFDEQVRFFLVPGEGEVDPETYRVWVVGHVVAVPILIVAAAALTWVVMRQAAERTAGRSAGC